MHFADSLNAVNLAACSLSLLWRHTHTHTQSEIMAKKRPVQSKMAYSLGSGILLRAGAFGVVADLPFLATELQKVT